MNIAFVLLTYDHDAPAGLERSTAALAHGLCELGHPTVIITGKPGTAPGDTALAGAEPEIVRLRSLRLGPVVTERDLLDALAAPRAVRAEVIELLHRRRIDLVCWADASFGLGYLAPAPAGVRTALKLAVLRTDPLLRQALEHRPDAVLTNSPYLIDAATNVGLETAGWSAVPNALLTPAEPPPADERESLRHGGPIRILARAEPHKGIAELIESIPAGLAREVEIVLAAAAFEYWPNMQRDVIARCRTAATAARGRVRILPALRWAEVPAFFAGAAVTIISTTSPETWCNAAAEALSAGTPVIGYDFGHVPVLTGDAGVMVPAGADTAELWTAARRLLGSREDYHAASQAAPAQVAAHTPAAAATAFLNAVTARH